MIKFFILFLVSIAFITTSPSNSNNNYLNPVNVALISNLNVDDETVRPFKEFLRTQLDIELTNYGDLDLEAYFHEFIISPAHQEEAAIIVNDLIITKYYSLLNNHNYYFMPGDYFENDKRTPVFGSMFECLEFMTLGFLKNDLIASLNSSEQIVRKILHLAIGPNPPKYIGTLNNFIQANRSFLSETMITYDFQNFSTVEDYILTLSQRLFQAMLKKYHFHKNKLENFVYKLIRLHLTPINKIFSQLLANHPDCSYTTRMNLMINATDANDLDLIKFLVEEAQIIDENSIYWAIETANFALHYDIVRFLISISQQKNFELPASINYSIFNHDLEFLESILSKSPLKMRSFALEAADKLDKQEIILHLVKNHRNFIPSLEIAQVLESALNAENFEFSKMLLKFFNFMEFINIFLSLEKWNNKKVLLKEFIARYQFSLLVTLAVIITASGLNYH